MVAKLVEHQQVSTEKLLFFSSCPELFHFTHVQPVPPSACNLCTCTCMCPPHRLYYRGALCMVLEQTSSSTENDGDSPPQEMHAVAGELLAMMSGDWDKRVLEAEVFWLALHLARYTHVHVRLHKTQWCQRMFVLATPC